MKKVHLAILLLILGSNLVIAQTEKEIINPKGNFYFGAEMGLNAISSFSLGEQNKSLQGGLLAEYYFAKHWSIVARVKYFETGTSFYRRNTHSGSWLDLGHDAAYAVFNGAVISIPVNLKWEYRIHKNLNGYIRQGFAYNYETKSKYDFSPNLNTNNPKSFGSFNVGFGFNYFVSSKTSFFIDIETYQLGGHKGSDGSLFFPKNYYTTNSVINIGMKYSFRK